LDAESAVGLVEACGGGTGEGATDVRLGCGELVVAGAAAANGRPVGEDAGPAMGWMAANATTAMRTTAAATATPTATPRLRLVGVALTAGVGAAVTGTTVVGASVASGLACQRRSAADI
jgi:hypothetical protein